MSKCGFIALVGRPNVGKSTLVNQIVGQKVSIVSDKPQTTRRLVRGVVTGSDWQMVLVDLPGFQRPQDLLTKRMQLRVMNELNDVDGVLFLIDAVAGVGAGDRYIAQLLARSKKPIAIGVNKIDHLKRPRIVTALVAAAGFELPAAEIFPISAATGEKVEELKTHLGQMLPPGPFMFQADAVSDLSDNMRLAELVREQVLRRTREEVPHAVAVEVQEVDRSRKDLTTVRAIVMVETDSQKRILVGKGGQMIKATGIAARQEVESQIGHQVHLDLTVKVYRGWRGDPQVLDRLGIE